MSGFSPDIPIIPEKLSIPDLNGTTADVLRLDRIHPVISGNKWYKLRFHLDEAIRLGADMIVTFGGAWSNHIVATAAACAAASIPCLGIIRGEEPCDWSPTLQAASSFGMNFQFISRALYKEKDSMSFVEQSNVYLIPEGGYSELGAKGAATMLDGIEQNYTDILCAVGTGTMMAGLLNATDTSVRLTGIPVVRDAELHQRVRKLLIDPDKEITLLPGYEFGGYAKKTEELIKFMNHWFLETSIPTDFVYTVKYPSFSNRSKLKNNFPVYTKSVGIYRKIILQLQSITERWVFYEG